MSRAAAAEPAARARTAEPVAFRWPAAVTLGLVSLVGLAAFGWPFVVSSPQALAHGQDAPWFFAVLLGLLALVVLAEIGAGGLDAKTVAVLGVVTAAGGALRVLSAGTAGLEPMFFLIVLAGRVLGRRLGFVVGALAMVTGAFLTGGVGPWLPFQMICMGWVGLGAALLPRLRGWAERLLLAGYGLVSAMLYGAAMNLWFWPFMGSSAPAGAGFVPGAGAWANLGHYAVFYVATSLAWDLPRGLLTVALVLIAGRPVLGTLRRAVRRASFGAAVTFTDAATQPSTRSSSPPAPRPSS